MKNNRILCFGELLKRLQVSDDKRFSQAVTYDSYTGGAEANTAVLLARLGMDVSYVSCVPNNAIGKTAINDLKSHGVQSLIEITPTGRMGLYFVEKGNNIRPSEVIYDRSTSSFTEFTTDAAFWKKHLNDKTHFHWSGISPATSKVGFDNTALAIETAKELGLTISVDFNNRNSLWKWGKTAEQIMPQLIAQSNYVVADFDSIEKYYQFFTDPMMAFEIRFEKCFTFLKSKIPGLEVLAMTVREINDNQLFYRAGIVKKEDYYFSESIHLAQLTDPIGAGDAFTGGLLYSICSNKTTQQTAQIALACGAIKQSIPGDFPLLDWTDINEFILNGPVSKIKR